MVSAIGLYSQNSCTSVGAFPLTAKNGCASLKRRAHSIRLLSHTIPVFSLLKRLRLVSRRITCHLVYSSSFITLFSFCPDLASGSIGLKSIRAICRTPLCLCSHYLR